MLVSSSLLIPEHYDADTMYAEATLVSLPIRALFFVCWVFSDLDDGDSMIELIDESRR